MDLRERPHSISQLRHKAWKKTWTYEGTGYSNSHQQAARWASSPIEYDAEKDFWLFKGVSKRIADGDPGHGGNVVSVLYLDSCQPDVRNAKWLSGRVLDLDLHDDPAGFRITLIKITAPHWKEAGIKKKSHKLDASAVEKLITAVTRRTLER